MYVPVRCILLFTCVPARCILLATNIPVRVPVNINVEEINVQHNARLFPCMTSHGRFSGGNDSRPPNSLTSLPSYNVNTFTPGSQIRVSF